MKIAMPLVNNFELVEMTGVLDILRRAKIHVDIISVFNEEIVNSSNGIRIFVDKKMSEINLEEYEMIILTGGMGTNSYYKSETLINALKNFNKKNKNISAICAAPGILANIGILNGKNATIFPECKEDLEKNGVNFNKIGIVKSENILTATSMNFSIDFALEIVEILLGKEKRVEIEKEIVRIW